MNGSSRLVRFIGKTVLICLLVMNIVNWFIGDFIIWMTITNVALLAISLYFMTNKVDQAIVKERIADSVLHMSQLALNVQTESEFYSALLNEVVRSVDINGKGSLMMIEEDNRLIYKACVGFDMDDLNTIDLKLEDTFLYTMSKGEINKSIVVENIMEYDRSIFGDDDYDKLVEQGLDKICATVSSPILINGQLVGMLNVDSTDTKGIVPAYVELVDFYASEISRIIHLYQIFDKTMHSAKYDHLTNILTRGHFIEVMNEMMDNPKTCPDQYVLVYCDLDKLKKVNDSFGHEAGDLYLKQFVTGMNRHLKGEEMMARLGGDEFVMVLMREKEAVSTYIDTCNEWLKVNVIAIESEKVEVKYSWGMALFPNESKNLKELINIADERMYDDKHKD